MRGILPWKVCNDSIAWSRCCDGMLSMFDCSRSEAIRTRFEGGAGREAWRVELVPPPGITPCIRKSSSRACSLALSSAVSSMFLYRQSPTGTGTHALFGSRAPCGQSSSQPLRVQLAHGTQISVGHHYQSRRLLTFTIALQLQSSAFCHFSDCGKHGAWSMATDQRSSAAVSAFVFVVRVWRHSADCRCPPSRESSRPTT